MTSIGGNGDEGGASDEGGAADNYGRTLTNVPSGYKGNAAEFESAAADGPDRPGSGPSRVSGDITGSKAWTINIGIWNSKIGADVDVQNLRRLSKQGIHVPGSSFSRFNNPDDRN